MKNKAKWLVLLLSVICLVFLCACGGGKGGGNKTVGGVSKELQPPLTNPFRKHAEFVSTLSHERKEKLKELVFLLKDRGGKQDYDKLQRYDSGAAGNVRKSNAINEDDYKQVSIWRNKEGGRNLTALGIFKFYKIVPGSDYILPKNPDDVKVEGIKPKAFEQFPLQLEKGKNPPNVLYYVSQGDESAFYVFADKLYLAAPFFGKADKNNELPVSVFIIEPVDFIKLSDKNKDLDKSYSSSVYYKQLSEDLAYLEFMLNTCFGNYPGNENLWGEYGSWAAKELEKEITGKNSNSNYSQKTSDSDTSKNEGSVLMGEIIDKRAKLVATLDTNPKEIRVLNVGEKFLVLDDNTGGPFIKIKMLNTGEEGYAWHSFLKYDYVKKDAVPQTAQNPSISVSSNSNVSYGIINANEVNVRKGPGKNYKSLGVFFKGDKVRLVNEASDAQGGGINWYQIEFDNPSAGLIKGWVRKDFINLEK